MKPERAEELRQKLASYFRMMPMDAWATSLEELGELVSAASSQPLSVPEVEAALTKIVWDIVHEATATHGNVGHEGVSRFVDQLRSYVRSSEKEPVAWVIADKTGKIHPNGTWGIRTDRAYTADELKLAESYFPPKLNPLSCVKLFSGDEQKEREKTTKEMPTREALADAIANTTLHTASGVPSPAHKLLMPSEQRAIADAILRLFSQGYKQEGV